MKTVPDKWFDRYAPYYEKVKTLIPNDARVFIVGANNGVTYDPTWRIWKDTWHGYYAEPNPIAMGNLQKNITFPNSTFIPYAMGNDGIIKLYMMSKIAAKAFGKSALIDGTSITSIEYDHVASRLKKHAPDLIKANKGLDGLINRVEVLCKSFKTVIEEYQIDRLDLVQIDVEGMDDFVITNLLECNKFPKIILCEHQHLSEVRRKKMWKEMQNTGYEITILRNDTMGVRL